MGLSPSCIGRQRIVIPNDNLQLVALPKPNWQQKGDCIWKSKNGAQVKLTEIGLNNLTRFEISVLQEIVYEEIQKLNVEKTILDSVQKVFQKLRFPTKKSTPKEANRKDQCNIFGKSLEKCFAQDQTRYVESSHQDVPLFVYLCIDYLEKHALHAVGLFRIGSSSKRIKEMRANIENDCINTIQQARSPHDVATLFKEYFRDLPEPLICEDLYLAFIKAQNVENHVLKLKLLSYLIYFLPPIHSNTLWYLLKFLSKVASYSDDNYDADGTKHFYGNKMDSKNLAMIFAPNILRHGSAYKEEKKRDTITDVIGVMIILIDNYEKLFTVPAEMLDKIYAKLMLTHPEELNLLFLCRKMGSNEF